MGHEVQPQPDCVCVCVCVVQTGRQSVPLWRYEKCLWGSDTSVPSLPNLPTKLPEIMIELSMFGLHLLIFSLHIS